MIYADWLLNPPYIVDNIRKQSRLIVLYSMIVFEMIIIAVIACIRAHLCDNRQENCSYIYIFELIMRID